MTSKILEDLADTRLARPEYARHECNCQFDDFCLEYGNFLRCYMDLKFKEKCSYYIQFLKDNGEEE